MMNTRVKVINLPREEKDTAVEILANSFYDYPFTRYIWPNDERRRQDLIWYFNLGINICFDSGIVLATKDRQGLLVGLRLDAKDIPISSYVPHGLFRFPLHMFPFGFIRMINNELYVEKLRKKNTPPDYWYLWGVGVKAGLQNTGLGTALIQAALDYVDQHKLPCYLETHEAANISLYEKCGFKTKDVGKVPLSKDLKVWAMLRPAQH